MTTRRKFTEMVAELIIESRRRGYEPFIDYVLRSAEEQNRLYREGKSKCDGYNKKSRHQNAKAVDIYFFDSKAGKVLWESPIYAEMHEYWEELGGDPMIKWDQGHFQV